MTLLLAMTCGVLFAVGLYFLMQRTLLQMVLGLIAIGHGANLAIFTSAGLVRGAAPLVNKGQIMPSAGVADALPQALILTAIVIGFAVTSFAAVLAMRAYQEVGTDDPDDMTLTDTDQESH